MKRSIKSKTLPDVTANLKSLGRYIRIARKRRKLSMSEIAGRLNVGYQTVVRAEKGDPGVSIGVYASILWLFGVGKQGVDAVHPDRDETGKALEISRLPKRVRAKQTWKRYDF